MFRGDILLWEVRGGGEGGGGGGGSGGGREGGGREGGEGGEGKPNPFSEARFRGGWVSCLWGCCYVNPSKCALPTASSVLGFFL